MESVHVPGSYHNDEETSRTAEPFQQPEQGSTASAGTKDA